MKFYEIETKAFFFEILMNVKRENPQSAYFL